VSSMQTLTDGFMSVTSNRSGHVVVHQFPATPRAARLLTGTKRNARRTRHFRS